MRIAFYRSGSSHDRIYVTRDDGSEESWRWPAGGPPHDLIHYAVETEPGLTGGFWGLTGYSRAEARSPELGPERFDAACDAAAAWTERWRALGPGETLLVEYSA